MRRRPLQTVGRYGADLAREVADLERRVAEKSAGDDAAHPAWATTGRQTATCAARPWDIVLCDPTGGAFAVHLPAPASCPGREVRVKNVSSSATTITIRAVDAATIDGAASDTISSAWGSVLYRSTGTEWLVLS